MLMLSVLCRDMSFVTTEIPPALQLCCKSLLCCDISFVIILNLCHDILFLCHDRVSLSSIDLLSRQTFSLSRQSCVAFYC